MAGKFVSETALNTIPKPVLAVPAIMLLIALFDVPYGYYVLLRLIVMMSAVYISYHLFKNKYSVPEYMPWLFLFMAILYNPIVQVPFDRMVWMIVNIGSLIFYIRIYRLVKPLRNSALSGSTK